MINIRDEHDVQIWCDYQEEKQQTSADYFLRLRFAKFYVFTVTSYVLDSSEGNSYGKGYGNDYGNGYGNGWGDSSGDGYGSGWGHSDGNGYGNSWFVYGTS